VAVLQRGNGGRGCRLRQVQRGGGTGHVLALDDSDENAKLFKGHRRKPSAAR
jgi:hypothetical protein